MKNLSKMEVLIIVLLAIVLAALIVAALAIICNQSVEGVRHFWQVAATVMA